MPKEPLDLCMSSATVHLQQKRFHWNHTHAALDEALSVNHHKQPDSHINVGLQIHEKRIHREVLPGRQLGVAGPSSIHGTSRL